MARQLDRLEQLCNWAWLTRHIVDPQPRILCKGSEQVLDECGLPTGRQHCHSDPAVGLAGSCLDAT